MVLLATLNGYFSNLAAGGTGGTGGTGGAGGAGAEGAEAAQAPAAGAAGAAGVAWLVTGSSWPERSEGHERSPAGVYISVFDHPEGKATVKRCVEIRIL